MVLQYELQRNSAAYRTGAVLCGSFFRMQAAEMAGIEYMKNTLVAA